jgi:hypothetical protein
MKLITDKHNENPQKQLQKGNYFVKLNCDCQQHKANQV